MPSMALAGHHWSFEKPNAVSQAIRGVLTETVPSSSAGKTISTTNFRHNEQIRISPIFLIDQAEEKVGVISTNEALRRAREAGLDLVEVAPTAKPPVCRIMDYGKWRYQQQKKEDKSRASSRGGQLKELKLKTVRIGDHDLTIKINHARDFLKEGNKVQFTLQFKGREMAHLELGRDIMKKIKEDLFLVSKVERDFKMEGRRMTLVLQPDHKAPGTKPPAPGGIKPVPKVVPGVVPPGVAPGVGGTAQLRSQGVSGAGEGLNIAIPAAAPAGPVPSAQPPRPAGAPKPGIPSAQPPRPSAPAPASAR